ncbi:energy-coupling factor transporter transmembrane component T family protein [Corynebacterium durum]|uniref:energy-coupling factor transporter transmembrane component T family protein n=1 Tax=Corynebacterium durum TaxID=61592 RepID=UPI0026DCE2B4|nr:energy-coupling factor transporter transmembrane component T [Corynebacterium durum]MDO4653207.1 energy-coupling factor transporter transmembrane component T [Corynebacterium durum]
MTSFMDAINPVTRIGAVLLLATPLLVSVDVVSAAVALTATILLAPLAGMPWLQLIRRSWPILAAAPISGLSMALYGRPEGTEYASFLFAHITDNSLQLALAIMVRVLAIGLPVVVLTARVDPTDFGDGLAQVLRLPARFVIGAVAGVRLLGLFRRDWASLGRARRARGVADTSRIRHAATMSFSLLVVALRRGTKLATAMEARGFGAPGLRTWGRVSTVGWRDAVVLMIAALISTAAIAVALYAGTFRFLGA